MDGSLRQGHEFNADLNQINTLESRKVFLTKRYRLVSIVTYLCIAMSVLAIILIPFIFLMFSEISKSTLVLLVVYAVIPIAFLPYFRGVQRALEQDLQTVDFEIDLFQFHVNERETRAEKVLRINNLQLQKYYDLNLSQNIWVFGLGVFCILLGISVIGITLYLVISVKTVFEVKVITGIVGTIGSLLSSYVAVIYLKMHASATSHLGDFHARLIETQQLLFGNLLASRIDDDTKRWETLSQIATNMTKGNGNSAEYSKYESTKH